MNDDMQEFLSEEQEHAGALEMSEFTVPVEQAAELFKEAGFARSQDHISRWCRQGVLQATKVNTKNRLTRYLINRTSIDKKIDQLRREQHAHDRPQVFSSVAATAAPRHNGDTHRVGMMPPRHDDGMQGVTMPPSFRQGARDTEPHANELLRLKNDEIQRLLGTLDAKREELTKWEGKTAAAEQRAVGIAIELGRWQHRAELAETKLLELAAPKPPEPEPPAPEPEAVEPETPANADMPKPSFWRRLLKL